MKIIYKKDSYQICIKVHLERITSFQIQSNEMTKEALQRQGKNAINQLHTHENQLNMSHFTKATLGSHNDENHMRCSRGEHQHQAAQESIDPRHSHKFPGKYLTESQLSASSYIVKTMLPTIPTCVGSEEQVL